MARRLFASVAVLSMLISGCRTESGTKKDLVGMWTWNPRSELPANQVETKGFPTPELEALQLRADGTFVYTEKIPGWDTQVAGNTQHIGEQWMEWKGTWSFAKGELELGPSGEADRCGASHEAKRGWIAEKNHAEGGRTFKLTELTARTLALHDLAIGGHDRTFHRTQSIPPRPTLGER